ncbi:MAG: dihydrolipoyl dehydrogenase family protein [bacterium]
MKKYDYDIVVIGGGAAGLTASGICAAFGARTALIEKHRLGGDCTWNGCVPSKALLHIAKGVSTVAKNQKNGVKYKDLLIDFPAVMDSIRKTRQQIFEDADSPEVITARGVEVIHGRAQFIDKHSIKVTTEKDSRSLSFRSAIITAGGSPLRLPIAGLQASDFLTNESLFELQQQPKHLVILGSGPIGVEMAQAFNLLGTRVTVIALDPRILIRDEPVCTDFVQTRLEKEGVTFYSGATIHQAQKGNGAFKLSVGPRTGADKSISCDALLMAVGRQPNLENLHLEDAGVRSLKNGIPVDRFCRTNVRNIFAAGDVTTFLKFTHVAENMAKTAAVNAVFRLPIYKYESEIIPWVTYTEPECAHVGKTAEELQSEKIPFETIEFPYDKIDRAVTEHASEGVIILHTARGRILGAHAAGAQAGEIINEFALAMKNGLKLSHIADTIHPYPTWLLGARRAADQHYVRLHKKWMSKLIRFVFRYQGEIPDYVGSKTVV